MKRLLLLGGGHAHVQVLRDWAKEPMRAAEVLLVSPQARSLYSGMVPGCIAGHYRVEDLSIALEPLARAAGVRFEQAQAVALDSGGRRVHLADGRVAEYDLLSLNTGPVQDRDRVPGASGNALFVRPIEGFIAHWPALLRMAQERPVHVVVVGAGAAGVELVLAMAWRLRQFGARLSLVTGGSEVLAGFPAKVQSHAREALRRLGVSVLPLACEGIEPGWMQLCGGTRLPCDAPVMATGSDPPAWLSDSGLQLDAQGFVATGPCLQSLSHAEVFAVGDIATRPDAPHPRSGVYAVRAGPPLALNLRLALGGAALRPYRPRERSLNLIACGPKRAIVAWGGHAAVGRWAWWWKNAIDRAFIRRFVLPGHSAQTAPATERQRS
jgi:pyridine nucleotide-disulfide oxidoreductase family protein